MALVARKRSHFCLNCGFEHNKYIDNEIDNCDNDDDDTDDDIVLI